MRMGALVAAGALVLVTALPAAAAGAQPSAPALGVGIPPPVDMSQLARVDPIPHPLARVSRSRGCIDGEPGNTADNTIQAEPWGQQRLRIAELWPFGRGAGQTVAVIDTGVWPHPRLTDGNRLVDGGDFVSTESGLADCDGHGTLVAGIIAASQDPRTGFAGVAPRAKILAIRQSSENFRIAGGPDGVGDVATLAGAVKRAADTPGVGVINISEASCSAPPPPGTDTYPALHAAVHYAAAVRDVVVVTAAGNLDPEGCVNQNTPGHVNTVVSPAWYDDDVLAVTSIDRDGSPSAFDVHGPWVDVAAPGTGIISLAPRGTGLTNSIADEATPSRGTPIQGTSFAAPYVSGVVALVRQRYPSLTAYQVMARIEQTAQHPAGAGGRNDVLGYGVIDPVAALTAVLPDGSGQTGAAAQPGRLVLTPPLPATDTPRLVALIGTAAGLGTLGLTTVVVFTARRSRRLRR